MSLADHLNECDVINSIRLQLRHKSGADKVWVLVEGKYDRLYKKLINGSCVIIEVAYGGVTALKKAVNELLKETDRIIGIRDADFIHLENEQFNEKNIFLTDFHDVEMMIISCDNAFNAVTAEYDGDVNNTNVLRENIYKIIAFVGGLKWLNYSEILELIFKDLGLGTFYNSANNIFDEDEYLKIVLQRSPRKKRVVFSAEVKMKISNVKDFLNLCNGHDFHQIFAKFITDRSPSGVGHKEVAKSFRIAYRLDDFKSTNLYAQLLKWSRNESKDLFKAT